MLSRWPRYRAVTALLGGADESGKPSGGKKYEIMQLTRRTALFHRLHLNRCF
jgi:hypothetical protein